MRNALTLGLATFAFLASATGAMATPCLEQSIVDEANAARSHIPKEFQAPAMMAMGDSMFNGVTSLTIDINRARMSVPSLVAQALGDTGFRIPAYPRPLLGDLEVELRKPAKRLLRELGPDIVTNIRQWQADYPGDTGSSAGTHQNLPPLFDNIAVAGATSDDLLCRRASDADKVWRGKPVTAGGRFHMPSGNLFDWHENINTSFILNPQDDTTFAGLSQMAQVMAREPTRLLINIGSNDGIWQAAFNGIAPQKKDLDNLVTNMRMVARLIPAKTKFAYLSTLVPPSRVPNLNPNFNSAEIDLDGKQYFDKYEPFVGTRRISLLSGNEVHAFDQAVEKENNAIQSAMRKELNQRISTHPEARDIHLIFVPFDQLLWYYDQKHDPKSHSLPIRWNGKPRKLNNRVLFPSPSYHLGGVTGFDNMHPSMVMYGRGAQEYLNSILTGPEKDLPAGQQPKALFDPKRLPQCAADELQRGHTSLCPGLGKVGPYITALNYSGTAYTNLLLAHEVLTIIPAPRKRVKLVTGHVVTPDDLDAGCAIVSAFDIVGHPSATEAAEAPCQ